MRSGFLALAALLGMATTAHAQQILSGGTLYGGPAQVRAVCYIYNSGTTSLQPLAVNQCGSTLLAGQACGIAANIAGNQVYSCKTVVSPNKANARGILEVRDSGQRTLQNVELR
jgi:hypothetical protein